MAQSSIVFLIDVNGIPKVNEEANESLPNESGDLFPESTGEVLKWLKEFVLVTLFKEANKGKEYDFTRVRWTYKFFDSSCKLDKFNQGQFLSFDFDSMLEFEKQLVEFMKKPNGRTNFGEDAYEQGRAENLSDALKIITAGLPWSDGKEDCFSSSTLRKEEITMKNSVYTFFRVPRTDEKLSEFTSLGVNASSKDIMGVLLPTAFASTFAFKLKIQLNFVDMWSAPENKDNCYQAEWKGSYPRQLSKCIRYLGGDIFTVPDYTPLTSVCMSFGLVPYLPILREKLQQASQNENIPSHIMQKLAPVKGKVGQKISPDAEMGSVVRSMKSGHTASVLEASYNSQSRILRPFRLSSGYDEDPTDNQDHYGHRGHGERAREVDRKRKRFDFELDGHYGRPDARRRYSGMDEEESVVDSLCEREQRLENWVKDGVFSATNKRKKHLDNVATVPMSRPSAMSKSFHVFHEPAPKLPGASRTNKMLAKVERHKNRASLSVSDRRRSSGEGLFDFKRIAQKQEKELSAIKRRLKTYLEGELDDDMNPGVWLKCFKDLLHNFSKMILRDEQPCLVALAQALVNCASVKFTQEKIKELRQAYNTNEITAKMLLEQLLILEFTTLNKKIIAAHEKSNDSNVRKYQFRETEHQIILRLEIAWCYFVEPDEDAMEELISEVTRLLQIIAAYRSDPPIEHFVNTVLLPTYSQSSKFMRALYKKMHIPLPPQLAMDGSPIGGSSRRDDDSSMISSTSSINLYPEDSASQLHVPKRSKPSPKMKRNVSSHHLPNKPKSGSKKTGRHIMVANSNPKMSGTQFMSEKLEHQSKHNSNKVSPKRVRRNLFDVQKKDKKDSKTLIALSSSNPRLLKSPAFKSPRGKSPRSPSGFFRAARSKRQLVLTQPGDRQYGSPSANNDVLCPESPATPGAVSVISRHAATSTSGSVEKNRVVIQESPEVHKHDFDNKPVGRIAAVSFYSTGSNVPKARAWEKSETQLMAARLKDSVDLRQELTMSDLELIPRSPDTKSERPAFEASYTPKTDMSYCADSYVERHGSPLPSTSRTHLFNCITGPSPNLDNASIHSLITRSAFPTALFGSTDEAVLPAVQTDPTAGSPCVPVTAIVSSPSNLQTPSKRVQFNLAENLVNTPSSAKRTSTGTPRSILKDTGEPLHHQALQ